MAHAPSRFTGPETMDALTADKQKMWHGFTTATTGGIIFLIILLVSMAVFLL